MQGLGLKEWKKENIPKLIIDLTAPLPPTKGSQKQLSRCSRCACVALTVQLVQ